MKGSQKALDVVLKLRDVWLLRDLSQHDFDEAISDLIKLERNK